MSRKKSGFRCFGDNNEPKQSKQLFTADSFRKVKACFNFLKRAAGEG